MIEACDAAEPVSSEANEVSFGADEVLAKACEASSAADDE